MVYRRLWLLLVIVFGFATFPAYAQTPPATKPFILPVASPSGASTWIMGQPYGNTTGAFVSGANSYSAGQYLHFGIDISMPCGTPVVAVANGTVHSVDNSSRGSAPHNVLLSFPDLNLSVLYGHLLERSPLVAGQTINQGDFVGLSGSPDSDCYSRPHLHFEVRSMDHLTAYNPVNVIQAPWHSLVGLGVLSRSPFQMDLYNSRQWMRLEDQPDVRFGGARLNNYALTYPPAEFRRAPSDTLPNRPFTPIPEEWRLRQLGMAGCCYGFRWHPASSERLYVMDGAIGQVASIYEIVTDGSGVLRAIQDAPPPNLSADGTHEIIYQTDRTIVRRLSDGNEWLIFMQNRFPILSPDNRTLAWMQSNGGLDEIWIGVLETSETQMIWSAASQDDNASVRWVDDNRLMISQRDDQRNTVLSVVNIQDGSSYTLGAWYNQRSLNIAPGGERMIFFSLFNADPANDGAFVMDIAPDAVPQKLPWFGDYRWRDAESVFYITFDNADIQQLHSYHIPSGETLMLTDPAEIPFTIANGDWAISPDGNTIAFQDARDGNLWLLEAVEAGERITTSSSES